MKAAQVQCVLWCGGCCGAVVLCCGSVVAITAVAGALQSKATPLLRLTLNLAACLAQATFGGTSVKVK